MAETKVIMPQMGESIFEGTLTKWLKKPGDKVQRDEPLFEISTDKIDSEIPAPASGTLQKILVQEGQTVEINTVVGIIGDERVAEGAAATAASASPSKPAATKPVAPPPAEKADEEDESAPGHVSPIVRRLAKEHGVDLAELEGKGTGINGRITKNDILAYIDQRSGATPAPSDVERVPMSAMRKSIAEHMVMSQRTSAHVTTFFEVDCSAIMAAREKLKTDFERAGTKLTVTPFFVLAAVRALKNFPILNASVEGDTIVYKKSIHVGIAVNVEGGLIVPVIKNAGDKNLQQLSEAINDLGERARTKKLTPDEVKGGTFSVTNPGQYGAVIGTPIINQPQVAILCMGGIKKRPVVVDDAIVARPMIMLALTFDHRIIDGALADQFMADIQKQLENWQG
jgi:pyruvate dehydrogenase E2 component (dihydrolipoamide acetyltransferase)